MDSNQLINIQGVYKLKNLRKLYLNKNPIQSLKGIEHLVNLEELYLDNTNVTSIVNNIDKLPNLRLLSINNRHRHIPFEEIRYLIEEKHSDVLPFKRSPYES